MAFRRLTVDGKVLNTIDAGVGSWASIAAMEGTRVLLSVGERPQVKTVIVDLARNAVVQTINGVRPARAQFNLLRDLRLMLPSGPIIAATDGEGRLMQLNMMTGAATPLPD